MEYNSVVHKLAPILVDKQFENFLYQAPICTQVPFCTEESLKLKAKYESDYKVETEFHKWEIQHLEKSKAEIANEMRALRHWYNKDVQHENSFQDPHCQELNKTNVEKLTKLF